MEDKETHSIFMTQEENNDISGKITMTTIMDTIPKDHLKKPLENWEKEFNVEYRWRFLEFPNNKNTVEISYTKKGEERIYFNRKGEWVKREVDPIYNQFVTDSYYYYCS